MHTKGSGLFKDTAGGVSLWPDICLSLKLREQVQALMAKVTSP